MYQTSYEIHMDITLGLIGHFGLFEDVNITFRFISLNSNRSINKHLEGTELKVKITKIPITNRM